MRRRARVPLFPYGCSVVLVLLAGGYDCRGGSAVNAQLVDPSDAVAASAASSMAAATNTDPTRARTFHEKQQQQQQQQHQQQCDVAASGQQVGTCLSSSSSSLSSPEHSDSSLLPPPNSPPPPFECDLYMAPSTIPGAGLGIFTAVPREPGEVLNGDSMGDVLIPVVDVQYHLTHNRNPKDTVQITMDYVWHGAELGMARESAHGEFSAKFSDGVTAFAPGLDAAINCHLALLNVDKGYPVHSTLGLHRSRDPGAGAFSPYHNCTTIATASIPAGGELFKFYGENWFLTRETLFQHVPLIDNYDQAQALLTRLEMVVGGAAARTLQTSLQDGTFTGTPPSSASTSERLEHDLYQLLKRSPWESRTLNALPSPDLLPLAKERGVRAAYQPQATRSLDYLRQHGRCLSAVQVKPSTIPQAGRGLFARTAFAEGDVVLGTPLLFGDGPDFLTLYDGDWWERATPPTSTVVGHQLLLNYCYQHPSAVLYLCPYGALVNLFNHNQTRANVRPIWVPNGALGHNASLLHTNPQLIGAASPGLAWDYVATRSIEPGEELFIDYGDDWEAAWQRHVKEFDAAESTEAEAATSTPTNRPHHPHARDPNYVSARDYNVREAGSVLRTPDEMTDQLPYPGNLELHCLNELGDGVDPNHGVAQSNLTAADAQELWTFENTGSPCRILERHPRDFDPTAVRDVDGSSSLQYRYTIELVHSTYNDETGEYTFYLVQVANVDREAIRFMDVQYSTDLFLPTAFRHPIGIPEELFPEAWRGYQYQVDP